MAGSIEGGKKAAATNKDKFGKDYYKKVGALGGKAKVPKGFAISGKAIEAGRKGGTISRRKPTVKKVNAPKDSKVTTEMGEKYEEVITDISAPRWLANTATRLGHFIPGRRKAEPTSNRDRR
jgi:uncharacterized protein